MSILRRYAGVGILVGTAWLRCAGQELYPIPENEARGGDLLEPFTGIVAPGEGNGENPARAADGALGCGGLMEGVSGVREESHVIPLEVGEHLRSFTVRMAGGEGDADLYVRHGEPPEPHRYDYRPYVNGNVEEVRVEDPRPGPWFAMVRGYRDFEGVDLELECVELPEEKPGVNLETDHDIELALYYELSGISLTNRVQNLELQHQLLNQRGRQAYNSGRFEEALEIWKQWMRADPDNPRPVSLVGDLYLRADNLEEALSYYRRSLEMQPGQVGLMVRLARLIDQQAGRPEEARKLLNWYSRLFPHNTAVALGQAEWLIRRNRYEEAIGMIRQVIEVDPENLDAMTMLHPLLRTQELRYANMRNMLRIGKLPGREVSLGFAVKQNDLLTQPESWVLMDFLERMAGRAPTVAQRKLFRELLPREEVTEEDFRIGRMSTNWISSREEAWGEEGNLILSADASQTEAFLRLARSDAMHNGFIEAEVDDTRGFFWIYARRGQGNMIRFGFEENGQLYLQVWMNNHLVSNQTRLWSRQPGPATLRLELRGDGAQGYVNGAAAFSSPMTIPADMGLGWWGIAPWSAEYGRARVSVRRIAGGPLPIRLGLLPAATLRQSAEAAGDDPDAPPTTLIQRLNDEIGGMSSLAPEWYEVKPGGEVERVRFSGDTEMRLMARFYRVRLLPMTRVASYADLDLEALGRVADRDRLDGFTFLVDRMPAPAWLERAEEAAIASGLTLHFVLPDSRNGTVSFRELCPTVGLFPGSRRQRTLPLRVSPVENDIEFSQEDPNVAILFDPARSTP